MYDFLTHFHSGLRWIALPLLIIAVFKSFAGMNGNKIYTAGDKKIALFTLISVHLQLVIGLILYVMFVTMPGFSFGDAMKNPVQRFFSVEHVTGMVVAIALITVGYSKAKRATTDKAKFKNIAIFYLIGLILILGMIPWPFMAKFASLKWF